MAAGRRFRAAKAGCLDQAEEAEVAYHKSLELDTTELNAYAAGLLPLNGQSLPLEGKARLRSNQPFEKTLLNSSASRPKPTSSASAASLTYEFL
jgi:hypothetical protein